MAQRGRDRVYDRSPFYDATPAVLHHGWQHCGACRLWTKFSSAGAAWARLSKVSPRVGLIPREGIFLTCSARAFPGSVPPPVAVACTASSFWATSLTNRGVPSGVQRRGTAETVRSDLTVATHVFGRTFSTFFLDQGRHKQHGHPRATSAKGRFGALA